MNIVCAPAGIVDAVRPKQGIMDMADAGFQNVLLDLAAFCRPGELENFEIEQAAPGLASGGDKVRRGERNARLVSQYPSELYGRVKPLLEQYQKAGLYVPIALAPYLPRNTVRKDLDGLLLRLAQESIRCCGREGVRRIIIKPLSGGITRGDEWDMNREFYLRLADAAKEHHVKILLENQCGDMNGHLVRGICSDPGEARGWIGQLNREAGEECFGFCVDVGICSLCGQNTQELICSLEGGVQAVVLRDCDGHREASMLPFTYSGFERSGTDWLGLIRGLRETGFDGLLLLDFSTTAAAFPPLLRPQLMRLARGTGEYFRWQVGMERLLKYSKPIVLFGAGNMCRNYMKCYGEKYPPLFTCDNNPRLWGTDFCGLEVKPPESLKNLPDGCVIFICNVYYREIQRQLREMGVSNEIEFFSDEYMPSFYFDRLERGE